MVAAACLAGPCAPGRRPDPTRCAPAGLPDIILSALVPEQIWALTPQAIAAVPAPKFAVSSRHPPLACSAGVCMAPSPCMQGRGRSLAGPAWEPPMPDTEAQRWDLSWMCQGAGAGPRRGWLPSPRRWCLAQLSCAPSPAPRLRLSPWGSAGGSAVPSARPWPAPSARERLPWMAKVRAAGWLLSPHSTQPACRGRLLCPVAPCPCSAPPGSARAPWDAGRAQVVRVWPCCLRCCAAGRLAPLPAQLMLPLGLCPISPLPRQDLSGTALCPEPRF